MSTTYNTSFVDNIQLPDNNAYPIRAGAIPYGEVDSTSTSTAFTATVKGIYSLQDGVCMLLKNGQITSVSGFTININNLGAKPVYSNLATGNDQTPTEPTRDTTIFNINYTMLFVYTTTLVDGGAWICYRGYDSNTNTIGYQLRTNSGNLEASDAGYKYRLWFTSADGKKWVPANTSTSTNATTARTMNTRPINPFGPIVYNSTNGTTASGARPTAANLWQQYTLTVGYSYVVSLTAYDPVYVQCTPQSDGSAVMNAIVKALPTSNDGKIYIYLGIAYSATSMELRTEHPVFYHDGTGIRFWTGKAIPTKTSDLTNDGDGTSAFATMADIGSLGGGTITAVKTTAGAHTAINVTSGAANFNVPTKTSHLTNDSGFITSSSVPTASTTNPLMDGTAAVGTSAKYAKEDHVHPTDTSRQAILVSGTNIKTINNESLLGSGNITLATQDYVNNLITGTYSYTTTITPNGTTSSYTINHNLNTYNTIVSVGLFTGGTADSGTLETVPQGVFTSNNSLIYTVKQTSKNVSVLTFNKNVPSDSPLRVNIIAAESYVNLSNAVTKSYVDSIVTDLTDINAIIQ